MKLNSRTQHLTTFTEQQPFSWFAPARRRNSFFDIFSFIQFNLFCCFAINLSPLTTPRSPRIVNFHNHIIHTALCSFAQQSPTSPKRSTHFAETQRHKARWPFTLEEMASKRSLVWTKVWTVIFIAASLYQTTVDGPKKVARFPVLVAFSGQLLNSFDRFALQRRAQGDHVGFNTGNGEKLSFSQREQARLAAWL